LAIRPLLVAEVILLGKVTKKLQMRSCQEEAMQACARWGNEILDCALDVHTSGDLGVAWNGPIASSEDTVVSFTSSATPWWDTDSSDVRR